MTLFSCPRSTDVKKLVDVMMKFPAELGKSLKEDATRISFIMSANLQDHGTGKDQLYPN